ncbi:MAG: response regulator [Verrucomicrobiota bacterium]
MSIPSRSALIAEDNELSLQLLSRAMERFGFRVIQCRSGREALNRTLSEKPTLLILDYEMPDLTGAEVCEKVRQSPDPSIARMPILLLTAHTESEHRDECFRVGVDEFVVKPVDPGSLTALIEATLKRIGALGNGRGNMPDPQPDNVIRIP